MSNALTLSGEIIWVAGIVAWYVIRYPFERRAKRIRIVSSRRSPSESVGLVSALLGLAIFPAFYVATGIPEAADRQTWLWTIMFGTILFGSALVLFRISHKELGRNWSVTLEIREKHKLVSGGPYRLIRHPMYTSFLLMALGQAFLLSNWLVALAGLAGFAILFFPRVGKEEKMMIENFGPQYKTYMERTKRLVPYVY